MRNKILALLLIISLPIALADSNDMWGNMMGFADTNNTLGFPMMWGMWNPVMILGMIFYFGVGSFVFSYIFWWTRELFKKKRR